MSKFGFIGTGNMAGALIAAAAAGGFGANCTLYNRTPAKAQALAQRYGCTVAQSAAEVAAGCDYLFLGVKPQQMAGLLAGLRTALAQRDAAGRQPVLVSMAAGLSIAQLKGFAGDERWPVVRIMPNTPCAIGQGIVFVTPDDDTPASAVQEIRTVLAACGQVMDATEHTLDLGSVVAGSTPAWACLFIEGLADGAVAAGMPRDMALACAAGAVKGAAALVLETGSHPGQLKDAVCSPGGSTIAGVRALEEKGVRGAAMDAVLAAAARINEMGRTPS